MMRVRKIWAVMTDHSRSNDYDNTLAVSRLLLVPALTATRMMGSSLALTTPTTRTWLRPSLKASRSHNREVGSPHTPNLQSTGRRALGKGARSGFIFSRTSQT